MVTVVWNLGQRFLDLRFCWVGSEGVENGRWPEESWDGKARKEGNEMREVEGEEDTTESEGGDPGTWGDGNADE